MTTTLSAVALREARADELEALMSFEASFYPVPDAIRMVLARNERSELGAFERVVVETDGQVVALGVVGSAELMGFGPQASQVRVYVCPDHRRRGLGTLVLRELERRAAPRGRDVVSALASGSPAVEFLSRQGYEEIRRQPRWVVDVNKAPIDAFEEPSAIAEAAGVTLVSYADARRQLGDALAGAVGALHRRLVYDMPAPLRPAKMRIEEYRDAFLGDGLLEDASVLAMREGCCVVGVALVERAPDSRAFARVVGAIGPYRAKRVPLALKLEALRRLRGLGYRALVIQDDQDNAPMRRILRGLGAAEAFDVLALRKRLR
jgi:GNAT superfamily N-acetyltransferase